MEPCLDGVIEEDFSELGVGQGECPKTQIGCRVGDRSQYELDSFNKRVDEKFTKTMGLGSSFLLIIFIFVTMMMDVLAISCGCIIDSVTTSSIVIAYCSVGLRS